MPQQTSARLVQSHAGTRAWWRLAIHPRRSDAGPSRNAAARKVPSHAAGIGALEARACPARRHTHRNTGTGRRTEAPSRGGNERAAAGEKRPRQFRTGMVKISE